MRKSLLVFGAAVILCCAARPALAAPIIITLDTSPLVAGVTGPYYLDFQLVDGDALANNSVLLSGFDFGGGFAVGAPILAGGATGDVNAGATLTDSSFFNELVQEFTPGNLLSFSVTFSTNFVAPTPDRFTFAVLNSSFFEVPTAGLGSELLGIDLREPIVIETYAGIDNGQDPVLAAPQVTPVPEPSTIVLLTTGIGALAGRRRMRRRARHSIELSGSGGSRDHAAPATGHADLG
jgi:hypothetical protein